MPRRFGFNQFMILALAAPSICLAQGGPPTIITGQDPPPIGTCVDSVQVGNVYMRSNNTDVLPVGTYRCTQILNPSIYGAAAYSWQPIGHFAGPALPRKCAIGDIAFLSTAAAGQNLYACTTPNNWSLQAGGGGGGGSWGSIVGTISSQADLTAALNLKSPLASPGFTGSPTAPTGAVGSGGTQIATQAYIDGRRQSRNPTLAYDSAPTGSELITGSAWTSTGWTGSYPTFTHITGNTTALTKTVTGSSGLTQVSFTVTGRTAGYVFVTLDGSVVQAPTTSSAVGPGTVSADGSYVASTITANSNPVLSFAPSTDFNGAISAVSVELVTGTTTPLYSVYDHNLLPNLIYEQRFSLGANSTMRGVYEGVGAGARHINAIGNVLIGEQSGRLTMTASRIVCVGMFCGYNNYAGYDLVGLGYASLFNNTEGVANVSGGAGSLFSNTKGHHNTAWGDSGLQNNTTGNWNAGLGSSACVSNVTGSQTTCIGSVAGGYASDSSPATALDNSVFIGALSHPLSAATTNETVIGFAANGHGPNTTTIGNASTTGTYLYGDPRLLATGKSAGEYSLCVDNSGNGRFVPAGTCSGGGGALSWAALTSGQWASLTSGQWAALTN